MALESLLNAEAVRQRCARIGAAVEAGDGRWFRFRPQCLAPCVERVSAECRANYPDLDIPFHSRWRHFVVDDVDLWQHYRESRLADVDRATLARTVIDLVVLSVILDAGAGADWRYRDPVTGKVLARSEGLAAATVELFFNHLGQDDGEGGLALNAGVLLSTDQETIAAAFQHESANPLLGLEGRVALLRGLGRRLEQLAPTGMTRPGHLYDRLLAASTDGELEAGKVLGEVLACFNPIWPSGLVVDDIALGDCGRHKLLNTGDDTDSLVPFHKLSQWLSYSLLEPLAEAGLNITAHDQLTGLPEYRNGGLFLDTGVILPHDPDLLIQTLALDHEAVVEWRALTVWLLDRVAAGVRENLGRSEKELPLASVLQGGTWSAGRKLAQEKRAGEPPIRLAIDGTVF